MSNIDGLGQAIRDAAKVGGASIVKGTTTTAPASGRVMVDIPGTGIVPVEVPGSFRSTLAAGQTVTIAVQQGVRTVTSILSALAAPTVTATPTVPSINTTASSGAYDYSIADNDWPALRAYTRDIATVTRSLAADLNALRSDVTALRTANATLTTTVSQLRAALQAQGNIT